MKKPIPADKQLLTKSEIRQALASTIRKVLDRHAASVAELAKTVDMVKPPGDDAGIAMGEKSPMDKCVDAGCKDGMHKCGEPMVKDESGCSCPNCKHPEPVGLGSHSGSDHFLCPQCTNMFERPQSGGTIAPEVAKEEMDKCGDVSPEVPMDKTVVKEHGKFELKTHDGSRTLGTHSSKAGAMRQERAIQAQKHMGKDEMSEESSTEESSSASPTMKGEKPPGHDLCEICDAKLGADGKCKKCNEPTPAKKGEDYIDPEHENTPGKRLKTVGKDGVLPDSKPIAVTPAPGSGGKIKKSDPSEIQANVALLAHQGLVVKKVK